MKRFFNLIQLDLQIVIRNKFHYVVLFLALLAIIVINFIIPKEVKITPKEMFLDLTPEKAMEKFAINEGVPGDRIFNSREELEREVNSNKNAIGVIMEGTLEDSKFTIIQQGTEPVETMNLLDSTIEEMLNTLRGNIRPKSYDMQYLRPKAAKVPFNKNMIPLLMVFEVVMFGFTIIAVMVFQEKEDGSIKAYRVSPAGVLRYILSKAVVNVLMALTYGVLIVLFTMGLKINYGALFLILMLTSFLMTIMGLFISVFFKNLSEFLFSGLSVITISSFPMISYLYPSFAPDFITFIPSYPVVFGIREILFPTGKDGFLTPMILMLTVEGMFFLAASYLAVSRKLMKEGR